MIDIAHLKQVASPRWVEVISSVCGLDASLLDGRHHSCPKCGGRDRFRLIDSASGAVYCNKCFCKRNGDGIAAVQWLLGLDFIDTAKAIASHLGLSEDEPTVKRSMVQEIAWRKRISVESLEAYGAKEGLRGQTIVCRVPMYSADFTPCSYFDMSTASDAMLKGLSAKDNPLGLFVADKPTPGDEVCVVEGVKDAAALHNLGYLAVGLPTCRMDASFARAFRGCHVVMVPDRDKAGVEGAEEAAKRLYGIAESIRIAELPAEYSESGGADVRDVIKERNGTDKVRAAIAEARRWQPSGGGGRIIELKQLSVITKEYIANLETNDPLVTLGLPDVDDALGGGVLPGEVVIIAGRPSHGKTTITMQALDHLAMFMPVLMISEEMSGAALAKKSLSRITTLPDTDWKDNATSLLDTCDRYFKTRDDYLIAESVGNVDMAGEIIDTAKRRYSIGAAAVDYAQLLSAEGNSQYEKVTNVSKGLKQAAVRNEIIILMVCQLGRGIEHRQTTCPKMSDLRDSGQLEQDADVILFVEWLHRSNPEAHSEHEFRIYVAKNRNRGIRKTLINCSFVPTRQMIYRTTLREESQSQQSYAKPANTRKRQQPVQMENFGDYGGEVYRSEDEF